MLMLLLSIFLLASLNSFFVYVPWRSFGLSCSPRWSRGSLLSPAPWLVSRRCSESNGSAPMRLVGISFCGGFCLRAPPSNHGHLLSTVEGYRPLYLPVVNLAPRWEGGMVGVRNERQTHLPTPPVWTAPLRSSLSSPSRGRFRCTGAMRGELFFKNSTCP